MGRLVLFEDAMNHVWNALAMTIWWVIVIRVLIFRLMYNWRAYVVRRLKKGYGAGDLVIDWTNYRIYRDFFTNHPVTVQIVTYNEQELLSKCLHACARLLYPEQSLEIQVLDNSTDGSSLQNAQLCSHVNLFVGRNLVRYIGRNNEGFKSGALRDGTLVARGDYIAILDVDSIPDMYWLCNMMKYFNRAFYEPWSENDERWAEAYDKGGRLLGMVQGRWRYSNVNKNSVTLAADALMTSYFRVEKFLDTKDNKFVHFNGSGGVWNKQCILESGNWDPHTAISIDVELSNRIDRDKWATLYVDDDACITTSLVPETWKAMIGQQTRWVQGSSYLTFHSKKVNHILTWATLKLVQYMMLWSFILFVHHPVFQLISILVAIPNILEGGYFVYVVGWWGWLCAIRAGIYTLEEEASGALYSLFGYKPRVFVKTPKSKKDVAASHDSAFKLYMSSIRPYIHLFFGISLWEMNKYGMSYYAVVAVISLIVFASTLPGVIDVKKA